MIKNGYYLKARCIEDSEIAHAPPHVREIWDYLLRTVNYKDKKTNGIIVKRGQTMRSYSDIQEALSWRVGWRKMAYSKQDCETTMNWLKKHTMIHTQKTTRGMIITVLNYDEYQDPENYETDTETYRKHTRDIQTADTINKKGKKGRKKEDIYITLSEQIEPFKNSYAPSLIEDFTLHWIETDEKGTQRWQLEKTWDVNLRLQKWKRQSEKWDYKESQRSQIKKVEEIPKHENKEVEQIETGFQKINFDKFK